MSYLVILNMLEMKSAYRLWIDFDHFKTGQKDCKPDSNSVEKDWKRFQSHICSVIGWNLNRIQICQLLIYLVSTIRMPHYNICIPVRVDAAFNMAHIICPYCSIFYIILTDILSPIENRKSAFIADSQSCWNCCMSFTYIMHIMYLVLCFQHI